MVGLLFNGFFASRDIIALDGVNTSVVGGWVDQNWKQLYIQFAYVCATCGYAFVVTAFLAKFVDLIPGLHLRSTLEAERLGMDEVEVRRLAILPRLTIVTTLYRSESSLVIILRSEGIIRMASYHSTPQMGKTAFVHRLLPPGTDMGMLNSIFIIVKRAIRSRISQKQDLGPEIWKPCWRR